MKKERLKPLNDFIFKKIFGEKGSENILIPFLNAILHNGDDKIVELEIIENKDLYKEAIEDKLGILDVRARTSKKENINIEVQLVNQRNMDKRTLFYWSKLYSEKLKQGNDYKKLEKVITINIINFNMFKIEDYHTSFHLCEDKHKDLILNDVLEVHFIELTKFREKPLDTNIALERWLKFLEQDIDEEILRELIKLDNNIKNAENKLDNLELTEKEKELMYLREKREHDEANIYSSGIDEGIEQGEKIKAIEVVKNMLNNNMPNDLISSIANVDLDFIKQVKNNLT